MNEAALPHEEWVAENPLSKAVRSDFEELEEKRRTVNLKASLEAARRKIIAARGAEGQAGEEARRTPRPATRGS